MYNFFPLDERDNLHRALASGAGERVNFIDFLYQPNCPDDYNPGQEDNYPPQTNSCGDACECEGNFDNDLDQDAADTTAFLGDRGRFFYNNPCTALDPCNGDFDCDGDVDAADTTKFIEDMGRYLYNNPCPQDCQTGDWCVYTP